MKLLPSHVTPSPSYPVLHEQVKLPWLLAHNAFGEHPPLFVEHSLISMIVKFFQKKKKTQKRKEKKRKEKKENQSKQSHPQSIQLYKNN